MAFGAAVVTWFLVQMLLDAASPLGPRLEAITGFIAVVVLLIVLNWFVHKVYWSEWIGRHHRQRRKLLASAGLSATFGLVLLGFTSVYREGFEVVLFLQSLELKDGSPSCSRACARPGRHRVVGVLTFWLHHKLPYRKMLILTGVLVGVVLVVMIGGTALTFQSSAGCPRTRRRSRAGLDGRLVRDVLDWETLGTQVARRVLVIGSYYAAEYVKVKRPQRRGLAPAQRANDVPASVVGSPQPGV